MIARAVFLLIFAGFAWAASDPATLATELRHLQSGLDTQTPAQILAALPSAWQIANSDGRYTISSAPLRALLTEAVQHPLERPASIRRAKIWLGNLARQLELSSISSAPSQTGARARLQSILSRREFAGLGPPSLWDRFRQSIAAWFNRLIQNLFQFAQQHPTGGKVVFWTCIAGVLAWIAFFFVRLGRHEDAILTAPTPASVPTGHSREWLLAARHASDAGDLREAIHAAYWAGASRLRETGLLPQDPALTPRESLRLLSLPPSPFLAPVASLTTLLERFWYSHTPATPENVRESFSHLEALGCKPD